MENLKFTLPKGFCAGFGRADMTPDVLPILLGSGTMADAVHDPLYASCTAVSDGENVALLIHMDMKDMPRAFFLAAAEEIEKETGVPRENVILNATHTHNCPHTSRNDPVCVAWRRRGQLAAAKAAKEALSDLAPAEISIGKGLTPGYAFVRRYLMADGTYKGIQSANPCEEYVAHETEADPELRVIRFERQGKKDIVLANWQCHAASAAGFHRGKISADFIQQLRVLEGELDIHFAYHNGASGNINMLDKLHHRIFENYAKLGEGVADVIRKTLSNMEKAESGKVRVRTALLQGAVQQDSDKRREGAKEWARSAPDEKEAVLKKYGFASMYEAIAINTRAGMAKTEEIPLSAISFGDVAFATTPFESFDINARQTREASPYKMTFSCAYTNGALGYMPAREIFPHGEYEVYVSRFECGTPEKCVEALTKMLQENKKEG